MLHLEIVTPEKRIFSDTVEDVYLPGADGEMGILELHAALVSALQPGELRYKKDGQVTELAIGAGFAEVTTEKVKVLTDLAVGDADIDENKVEKALKAAEEAMANAEKGGDSEDMAALQATIAKSMAQLNLKRKRRSI